MKIYRIGMYENPSVEWLANLTSVEFAHFSAIGTWSYRREPCKTCTYHWQDLVPPLLVQWERSTNRIGDFYWDGPIGDIFIVKRHVAETMNSLQFGCAFLPAEVVKPERKRNTVEFPYIGPELLWVRCNVTVDLDMRASKVVRESSCPDCGDVRYTNVDKGIVIRHKDWKGEKLFRISSNPGEFCFVTEEGRRILEHARFSNIAFTEAGEIQG